MQSRFRKVLAISSIAAVAGFLGSGSAEAQGTLRFGMNLSDIPSATCTPTHGGSGFRFMGWPICDALLYYNMNQSESVPVEIPWLAQRYYVREEDPAKWVFELRRDATFHDGTPINADAIIWNIEKLHNPAAPQFDETQIGANGCCMLDLKGWRAIDEWTVELDTGTPNSFILSRLPYLRMASPTAWKKAGSWQEFAKKPVGSGPFMVEEIVPRERAVLVPFKNYWNKDKIPKLDKFILIPIPDHNTRAAALLSGQVDMIEVPPPDTIARLEAAGKQIITNKYPHVWPWFLRQAGDKKTPLTDVRVRKAINLAVDREGIVSMLNGYAVPAKGFVLPESAWFGNPSFDIRYDPDEARRLLKEAGYGPDNPVRFTMAISHGGSGQMQPLPMNEYIQQNLKEVGIEVEFEVMEWQAMRAVRNKGPRDSGNDTYDGINNSWSSDKPADLEANFATWKISPKGVNWGVSDPMVDGIFKQFMATFDQKEQDRLLAEAHTRIVDQAYQLWVVHDIGVHAADQDVKGFVPEISWTKDFTSIYIAE
jgi:peptide/nickel transport system substrate-binding protein